ncbi:MAG TPA: GNAT family N-acetyltransferase [Prosthecobacter sp.]|nr:GNAT family N-acetyltransferase [Prosthecobacter sp.]
MPFELQPTLKGRLLELRPLQAKDFDALYAVASDPLIWEQHPFKDRYKDDVFRNFFRVAMESGGALAVIDLESRCIIGSSRYHLDPSEANEVEIGWTFLARSHWGGVYNHEMKDLMLRHAFRFVDRVVFLIGPRNIRSRKAIERIGGVYVEAGVDDNRREYVIYEIKASNFVGLLPNANSDPS